MLGQIGLENFKSWQQVDIDLAPITLLFGTNSSGKTSILQALLFLLQTAEKTSWETVNFGGANDYVNLGSFRDVVFNHDQQREIMIGLRWWAADWYSGKAVIRYEEGIAKIKFDVDLARLFSAYGVNLNNNSPSISYLGPLREYPQRSYLWSGATPKKIEPDGENAIAVLVASERSGDELQKEVAKWLLKMELVDGFSTKALDPDRRFYETLVKIGDVETALVDVGFGVSQVLPVITTLFFVPEYSTVLLEQPELHLHPRAQAHLADLFLHIAETRKLQLIVESHSEHLLRRLQRRIAEAEMPFTTPENIKMYFCEKGKNGSTIQPVVVDDFGQIKNWPEGFFGDITGDLEKLAMAAVQRSQNGN